MSVINQMLQDLDKRKINQQIPEIDAVIQDIAKPQFASSAEGKNNHFKLLALALIIASLLAGAYYLGSAQTQMNISTPPLNSNISQPTDFSEQSIATHMVAVEAEEIAAVSTSDAEVPPVNTPEPSNNDEPEIKKISVLAQQQALPKLMTQKAIILASKTTKPSVRKPKNSIVQVKPLVAKNETKRPQASITQETDTAVPEHTQIKASSLKILRTQLDTPALIVQERNKADLALSKRDLNLAREHLQKILLLDPSKNETRSELASLYFGSGKNNQAVSTLEQGLVISPNYPNFRLLLARIFLKQDNAAQAYYYLKPLRPPVKTNLDYHAMLAVLAQKNKDSHLAQETYLSLVKAQPDKAQWWLGLGIAQDTLGLIQKAKISYQQAQLMGQLSNSSRVYIENRLKALEPKIKTSN